MPPFPLTISLFLQFTKKKFVKWDKAKEKGQPKPNVEGPGPDHYQVHLPVGGASYSLGSRFDEKRVPMVKKADGSRFDSQLRAKPHLRPKKVDGPGPGDYKLQDSVQTKYRAMASA